MMSDHTPQHGARNLALRTITAIVSTLLLAFSIGLVALGLPVGIVNAFDGLGPPIASVEVVPAEPDRMLVCMGPALSFGSQSASAVGYGPATETIAGSDTTVTPILDTSVVDGFSLESALIAEPPVVVSQPVDSGSLAASSSQTLNNLNVTGLATSECQIPSRDAWLVGGETTVGRQTALSLINPSDIPALVDISVWGETGPIVAPLGRGILVAPMSQRVLSVAGLAPEERSPVLRVTSAGVGIVATLHYSIYRGLEADGLSVLGSQPGPSTERVITGAYSPPEEVSGPIRGKDGYQDFGAIVRLLSPDEDTRAQVTVALVGAEPSMITVDLVAGETKDLLLDEFGSGDLALLIQSSAPVVASIRTSVGTDQRTDTDWAGSAPLIIGETAFAVPAGGEARISLVNPGTEDISVSLDGRDVSVPARSLATRPVSPGGHQLSSTLPVYAGLSLRGETVIDSVMVLPTPERQGSVFVSVR